MGVQYVFWIGAGHQWTVTSRNDCPLIFRTLTTHSIFFTPVKVESSPYINHFLQPDSLIPDPSNPQAWNRYSYVGNNPVNANDPSGHFTNIVVGAALGAMAGAAIYAGTTWASGRAWNNSDYLKAVGVGTIGGGLIGTGIGIGAGWMAFSAIGAGTGAIGSQLGYSVASKKEYDSDDMMIAAGVGAVTGAITGGVQGSVLANTTTAYAVNVATNGVAGSVQYAITEKYHGRDPDVYEALHIGAESAIMTAVINSPDFVNAGIVKPGSSEFYNLARQQRFAKDGFKDGSLGVIRMMQFRRNIFAPAIRTAGTTIGGSLFRKIFRSGE